MEGPIVDGWLESYQCTPEPRNVTQCGESVEQRVDYVKAYSFEQGISCESPMLPTASVVWMQLGRSGFVLVHWRNCLVLLLRFAVINIYSNF
jgi:hypothetical protein